MNTIKTLEDIDKVNDIAFQFKQLEYSVNYVLPRMNAVAIMVAPSNSIESTDEWVSINFTPELAKAIIDEGRRQLTVIADKLREYGIDIHWVN